MTNDFGVDIYGLELTGVTRWVHHRTWLVSMLKVKGGRDAKNIFGTCGGKIDVVMEGGERFTIISESPTAPLYRVGCLKISRTENMDREYLIRHEIDRLLILA